MSSMTITRLTLLSLLGCKQAVDAPHNFTNLLCNQINQKASKILGLLRQILATAPFQSNLNAIQHWLD